MNRPGRRRPSGGDRDDGDRGTMIPGCGASCLAAILLAVRLMEHGGYCYDAVRACRLERQEVEYRQSCHQPSRLHRLSYTRSTIPTRRSRIRLPSKTGIGGSGPSRGLSLAMGLLLFHCAIPVPPTSAELLHETALCRPPESPAPRLAPASSARSSSPPRSLKVVSLAHCDSAGVAQPSTQPDPIPW
jgi:hypothetical protein